MRNGMAIIMLIFAIMIAGCGSSSQGSEQDESAASSLGGSDKHEGGTLAGGEAEVTEETFRDLTGTEITVALPVERVACLTEICVDALVELGLEPVAVTAGGLAKEPEFYGDRAASLGQIGGSFLEPNLEDISLAGPDLVIGLEGTHEGLRDGLGSIAPLYIVQPKNIQDSIQFLEHMGRLTGRTAEAEHAKQRFLNKLAYYKEHSPKNESALAMYGSDVNFGIDTAGSLVGSMLAEVTRYPWPAPDADGGHQAGGMAFSLEKVLETDPDYLFVETFRFSPDSQPLSEQFKSNPLWAKLSAVHEGRVHEVRTSVWASGRGTRSLGIILDEVMGIMYPDVYEEAVESL